ncbi:hypothetical protein Taro_030318 [Colocasia esculenta]|uniref:CCHC-type domain-containing protein n=1 Tax=Colocasia esculenta TaxID=4460 RepID=A0A843VRM0_COLES|nr:hypothetical protein [Colocasia esculenta]
MSRRLQRILAKKKEYQSGRRDFKNGKDFKKPEAKDIKKNEPICYECKKPGHIKAECPKLKKSEIRKESSRKFRRYKKKAMAAAWDNSSDSDSESSSNSEEEGKANLAFMADIAKKVTSDSSFDSCNDSDSDNLEDAFNELYASKEQSTELWHRRLGHCSLDGMRKLIKRNLVEGLPKVSTKMDGVCGPCAKGKHTKSSFEGLRNS